MPRLAWFVILKIVADVKGGLVHKYCQFIIKIWDSHSPLHQQSLLQSSPAVTGCSSSLCLHSCTSVEFTLISWQALITFIRSSTTVQQLCVRLLQSQPGWAWGQTIRLAPPCRVYSIFFSTIFSCLSGWDNCLNNRLALAQDGSYPKQIMENWWRALICIFP